MSRIEFAAVISRFRISFQLTGFILFVCLAHADDEQPIDLKSILQESAVNPPAQVHFREQRHNPMLKEPLVLTGVLEYVQPGVLRKTIETPFHESYLVEAGSIAVERDGEVRRLPMRQGELMSWVLDGMEALLAGNSERLEAAFKYRLEGNRCAWSLQLEPRSQRLLQHLKGLLVAGGNGSVRSIRIDFGEDEWHLMEIIQDAS